MLRRKKHFERMPGETVFLWYEPDAVLPNSPVHDLWQGLRSYAMRCLVTQVRCRSEHMLLSDLRTSSTEVWLLALELHPLYGRETLGRVCVRVDSPKVSGSVQGGGC